MNFKINNYFVFKNDTITFEIRYRDPIHIQQ